MNCTEIIDQLSAYIDGALDAETRAAVEQHLRACSACAKEHEELVACVETMRALPVKQAPADLARRVRERLAPRFSFPYRLAGVAAGLLLAVIVADVVRETRQNVPLSSVVTAPVASGISAGSRQAAPVQEHRMALPADAVKNEAPVMRGIAASSADQQADRLAVEGVSVQKHDAGAYAFQSAFANKAAAPLRKEVPIASCVPPLQPSSGPVTDLRVHAREEITDATRRELAALVERLQGTVLDFDFAAPLPAMMAARVPAGRLQELAAGLSRFGVLEKTPSQPAQPGDYLTIIISLDRQAQ